MVPTEQAAGWVPGLAWTFLEKGKTSCLCQGWIQSVALSLYLLCNPGSLVTVAMETLIIVWEKGCTRKSFAEQYAVRGQVILYLTKYKMTIFFLPNYHPKFGVTLYYMKFNTFSIDVFLQSETYIHLTYGENTVL